MLDQIGLPDASWSNQDHILLCVFSFLRPGCVFLLELAEIIGMIIMIADRNREHLLGLVLLDYKTVKVRFDVARQKIENELFTTGFRRWLFARGSRFRLSKGRHGDMVAEVRLHKLRDFGLQFFR